jgi:calcineurin-like phosphoesterase family protein
MSRTWLISDTHWGHKNIVNFLRKDGTKLRPWDNIDDHDQALIENWNSVVKPEDKVYHLGDLGLSNSTHLLRIISALHGTKILIKGNHDTLKLSAYQQVFKDVRAYHSLNNIFLAHIPIHPNSLGRWKGQIHGHLHADVVLADNGEPDVRYKNVACEQINYTPIDFDEVNEYFKQFKAPTKDEYGAEIS